MSDTIVKPVVDTDALNTIAALISADIAARHGVIVQSSPSDVSFKGDAGYATLEVEGSYGVFAMIVEHVDVHLRCEPCSDGSIWVLVDLRYKHHGGGRNGSTVGTWWIKDGQIAQFRAN